MITFCIFIDETICKLKKNAEQFGPKMYNVDVSDLGPEIGTNLTHIPRNHLREGWRPGCGRGEEPDGDMVTRLSVVMVRAIRLRHDKAFGCCNACSIQIASRMHICYL
jgi:hypothetical protein